MMLAALINRLIHDVPVDRATQTAEQHGRWLLAHVLDFHRREDKAVWWEYYRLSALSSEELLDERAGLSGLAFIEPVGGTAKAPIHRYRFPPQDTDLRGGEDLRILGGARFGKVAAIYDKTKSAVVIIEGTSTLEGTSEPLFKATTTVVLRGEGGWGGDRGPSLKTAPPEKAPDHSVTYQTSPDQALIYRLSGDRNPLHSDPAFAAMGGFDRPILHSLCTYGFTGRALLHALADGDPAKFKAIDGRFSDPVFPGEALTVNMWATDASGVFTFQTTGSDGRVVLDGGRFVVG